MSKQRYTSRGLDKHYLGGEYFEMRECGKGEKKTRKRCRKTGIVTAKAEEVAKALGTDYPRMSSTQLRRFFNHARGLEKQLKYGEGASFEQLKSDIERLITFVVDARGKNKVPRSFETFIRVNVNLALRDEEHFIQGFMPHFEAVVAYFSYHFPRY